MIADLKPYAEYKESGLPWLGRVPGHWESNALKSLFARCERRKRDTKKQLSLGSRRTWCQSLRENGDIATVTESDD